MKKIDCSEDRVCYMNLDEKMTTDTVPDDLFSIQEIKSNKSPKKRKRTVRKGIKGRKKGKRVSVNPTAKRIRRRKRTVAKKRSVKRSSKKLVRRRKRN